MLKPKSADEMFVGISKAVASQWIHAACMAIVICSLHAGC